MLITSDAETISGDKVGSSATAEASGSNAVNSVIVFFIIHSSCNGY
ncbi:hypothetical protein D030_0105 [Vibrio parahaemolyticus AQ3810]|nr:hypothetical protein D039_2916 [Vibrio parahaemolyticus EKP-028]EXF72775.1 hypothetical protein D030_0105 [Vibrio parahaemolyticus AQ3810]